MSKLEPTRRFGALGALVVGCVGLLAACGGGAGTTERFGSGEQFSVRAALDQIPLAYASNEAGRMEIYIADLVSAGEVNGQSPPVGSDDATEAAAWIGPMTGFGEGIAFAPVPFALRESVGDLAGYRSEVGFALTDVDSSIEVVALPNSVTILAGNLEPTSTIEVAEGVLTIGEGDDFAIDLENPSTARPFGRPLRLAALDGLVALTPSTELASAWLDANSPRLAQDQSMVIAADALDSQGVLGAALFRSQFSSDLAPIFLDGVADADIEVPISVPFDTVGLGWGADSGEPVLTLVYVTDSKSAAETMAGELRALLAEEESLVTRQPFVNLLLVREVKVEGPAVVASLQPSPGTSLQILLDMLMQRDLLFVFRS